MYFIQRPTGPGLVITLSQVMGNYKLELKIKMQSIKSIPYFFKVVLFDIQFTTVSVSPRKLVRKDDAD